MLKTFYEVRIYHEDYFDHYRSSENKPQVEQFGSLIDAFKFYKESKAKDYCWPGDHERSTFRPVKKIVFVNEQQSKHGYVRGHEYHRDLPWETLEPWYRKPLKKDKDGFVFDDDCDLQF